MYRLDAIYASFNENLFEGSLAVASFKLNLARKSILHFKPPNEIEIGSGAHKAEPHTIIDELLHVMVHIDNQSNGIEDHNANHYHNQRFKSRALQIGLWVGCHQTHGWANIFSSRKHASIGQRKLIKPDRKAAAKLQKAIKNISSLISDVTKLREDVGRILSQKTSKRCQLKYVCRCESPNNSIRSGRRPDGDHPLNITCNACRSKFRLESQ